MVQAATNGSADHLDQAISPATPPQSTEAAAAKIHALLSSKQYGVIYETPYQGEEDRIVILLQQCETLNTLLANAKLQPSLEMAVRVIDSVLVPVLPGQEVRTLVKTIVDKDPNLINHMPQVRQMLERVYRAIELSMILDPKVLERISADIANQSNWGIV